MSLTGFPISRFGGLNLVDDPQEVGAELAIDLLNVDLDSRGRVSSRSGYDNLTSSAAASRLENIGPFYKTGGTKQLLVSSSVGQFFRAYSTAGAIVATQATAPGVVIAEADFTRFGGPAAEVAYIVYRDSFNDIGGPVFKWDGAAFTGGLAVGTGGVAPFMLEVKASDNRLVGAHHTSNWSRVGFSGAGTPETWGALDYVDLTPGDGERIRALVSWRELVFAFKETKFFVFTQTGLSGTGTPVFNYIPVNTGVGMFGRACAAPTPHGVYFLSRRGIYLTTGGDPTLVSAAIDPIFRGTASDAFQGGLLNHAAITACQITWHDERLFFAYPSGSSTVNDRLLVYDPRVSYWLLWNIPINSMTSFRTGDEAELVFTYSSGSNHIGRHSITYTDDDGTAISTRYQSGFYELSPTNRATTRWSKLWGSGSPTFDIYTDHATSDPLSRGAAVTLGTAPAVSSATHNKSYTGELFSHKLSSTSGAWSVNRIQHDIAETSKP